MNWKWAGPIVLAVFIAGVIGVWTVISLVLFYDVNLQPIDVAINMAVFMTLAGWWTERLRK